LEIQPITIGSKAALSVVCSICKKEVPAGEYFTYKDKKKLDVYYCSACREALKKAYAEEMSNPNLMEAGLVGCLGATIAGFLWYWIVQMTQWQSGYLSIGVGFLIGYAVYWGSGKKRGPSLQMLSAFLTFITLYASNYFIALQAIKKYYADHPTVWLAGGEITYISPFNHVIVHAIFSPIGLLIWGIGIYFAYQIPKHKTI